MSLVTLANYERFLDRVAPATLLAIGLMAGVAVVAIGG